MGYSYAIQVDTAATATDSTATLPLRDRKAELLAFMGKHYVTWTALSQKPRTEGVSLPTGELDYGRKARAVGFNHSCSVGFEREYMMTVLRWMGIRVGATRLFKYRTGRGVRVEYRFPFIDVEDAKWPIAVVADDAGYEALVRSVRPFACDGDGNRWGIADCALSLLMDPYIEVGVEDMSRIHSELGPPPSGGGVEFEKWDRKRGEKFYEFLKGPIDESMGLIRAEMARLSGLWASEALRNELWGTAHE